MKFEVIATAKSSRGSSGRTLGDAASTVLLTIQKSGKSSRQLALRIGKEVMKSQRWLVGDRVITDLVKIESGELAFRIERSTTDGHALSASSLHKGKMETATIKIRNDMMISYVKEFSGYSDKPLVVDGALLFILKAS
jgi:hypothetical protein